VVGTAGLGVATLLGLGFSSATSSPLNIASVVTAAVAGVATLVTRAVMAWLPYRFVRARAIAVSQPDADLVAALAVRSRGVRDLRGLSLATIFGALGGRWPLATMFRPWRGEWRARLPHDPAPVFRLAGLRLPTRSGNRWLSILEIRPQSLEDVPLPWEQWLGAAVSAKQAQSLLWYRRTDGRLWVPTRRLWQESLSEFHGPSRTSRVGQAGASG